MINDSLIAQFIDHRLKNEFNGSVVITGMDNSGKSTMATKLASKYRYAKFSYTYGVEFPYNWNDARYIQIFDRCPLFEFYVYNNNGDNLSEEYKKNMYDCEFSYIKSHLKYFDNPLFVFYLHSLWDNGDQPKYIYKNKEKMLSKYLDIIEMLNKLGQPMIVCTKDGIKQYNILYNTSENMKENRYNWG